MHIINTDEDRTNKNIVYWFEEFISTENYALRNLM